MAREEREESAGLGGGVTVTGVFRQPRTPAPAGRGERYGRGRRQPQGECRVRRGREDDVGALALARSRRLVPPPPRDSTAAAAASVQSALVGLRSRPPRRPQSHRGDWAGRTRPTVVERRSTEALSRRKGALHLRCNWCVGERGRTEERAGRFDLARAAVLSHVQRFSSAERSARRELTDK